MSSPRAVEQWGLNTSAILKTWFYLFHFVCHPVAFHDECLLRDYLLQFLVQILMSLARATKAVGQHQDNADANDSSLGPRGRRQFRGTVAALYIGGVPFTHPFLSSVCKYSQKLSTLSCSGLKLYSWMKKKKNHSNFYSDGGGKLTKAKISRELSVENDRKVQWKVKHRMGFIWGRSCTDLCSCYS